MRINKQESTLTSRKAFNLKLKKLALNAKYKKKTNLFFQIEFSSEANKQATAR